jgi:hypothetical protein
MSLKIIAFSMKAPCKSKALSKGEGWVRLYILLTSPLPILELLTLFTLPV